ncbi:MAG: cupin domain-containing protein [bacterium]
MQVSVMQDPCADRDFDDWGKIPDMISGESHTFGKLLHRNADGSSETGIWNCTPGTWHCHVTSDEFCHFLSGRCIYTSDSGDTTEVAPGTIAFFPKGWRGTCAVSDTVRKVYMIR